MKSWTWEAQSGTGNDDYLSVGLGGGTRAMSWHDDGKIGIGTTTPGSKLSIEDGDLEFLTSSAATIKNKIIFSEAVWGDESFYIEHDGAGAGAANLLKIYADGSGGTHGGIVLTRDTKVGIGTDSPTTQLTISGVQELVQLTRGGVSDSKWFFSADSAKLYIAEDTSATANIKLTIADTGNVGIGTETPSSKLQIGSRGTASALTINAASGDGILFDFYNDGNPYLRHASIIANGDSSASQLEFWTSPSGAGVSKALTLDSSQNATFAANISNTSGQIIPNELSMGDNKKILLGNGDDAEIQHTGSHLFFDNTIGSTYIRNTGVSSSSIIIRNSDTGDIQFDNEFAGNILFNTSNVQRMSVNSAGTVCIGPDALDIQFSPASTSGGKNLIYLRGNAAADKSEISLNHYGYANMYIGMGTTANTVMSLTATSGGTDGIIIDTSGNVGIGTDTPASILHLASATNPVLRVEDTTNSATVAMYATDSDLWMGAITNHPLKILTNDVTAITIDTSQDATFAGQVNVAETLKIGGATTGTKTLIFESTTNAQDYNIDFYSNAGAVQGRINYAEGAGSINLSPNSSATAALSLAYDGDATFAGDITISNATPAITLTDTDNSANIVFSSIGGALQVDSASDQIYQIGSTEYFRIATTGATFAGDIYLNSVAAALTIGETSETDSTTLWTNNSDTFYVQQDVAGAKMQFDTDQFIIKKVGASENIAIFAADGAVKLYYNASKKFETTDAGATVTGDLQVDGIVLDAANIQLDTSLTSGSSGTIIKFGGTTVIAGYYYVLNDSSGWDDTQADDVLVSKGLIGVAMGGGVASTVGMLTEGIYYDSSHGFTIGAPLYLSAADNNEVTTTAPTGSEEVVRVMGYAIDANHIYLKPDNTWILLD